jgi:tetratricopeptide (TPR) repeat protein
MTTSLGRLAETFPPRLPPSHFVDRQDELRQLNVWYSETSPEPLVISGAAGIGKTALAARFSQLVGERDEDIIWVSGSNRKLVAQEMEGPDSTEPDRIVFRRIRASLERTRRRSLLVLDDENDVEVILAATPRKGQGRLLVTTRDTRLGTLGRMLLLRAFEIEDTRRLIIALKPSLSTHDAARLAESLQGIPLAIELAVKTLEHGDEGIGTEQLLAGLDRRAVEDTTAATRQTVARRAVKIAREDYEKGISLLESGHYEEAESYLTRATSSLIGELGPDSPDALAARSALAECYRLSGRPLEAIDLMRGVLEGYERTLGPGDVNATLSAARLGAALRDAGRMNESIEIYEAVVPKLESTLGEDHPETITATASLAVLQWEVGDRKRALSLQRRLVRRATSVFGKDHPEALTAMSNLAYMLSEMGDVSAARRYQEQVLEASRRVLGPDHPDTLSAAGNLATLLYQMDDLKAAEELESSVVAGRRRILGPGHPDSALALNNLAITQFARGESAQAVKAMKEVVDEYRKLAATQQEAFLPELARALTALAAMLAAEGKQTDALAIIEESVHLNRLLRERGGLSSAAVIDALIILRDLLEGAGQTKRMHEVEAELGQLEGELDSHK